MDFFPIKLNVTGVNALAMGLVAVVGLVANLVLMAVVALVIAYGATKGYQIAN